jgi:hypothetical protein
VRFFAHSKIPGLISWIISSEFQSICSPSFLKAHEWFKQMGKNSLVHISAAAASSVPARWNFGGTGLVRPYWDWGKQDKSDTPDSTAKIDAETGAPDFLLPSPAFVAERPENRELDATGQPQESGRKVNPYFQLNRHQSPIRPFTLLQAFEGLVEELNGDYFFARLHDLTCPSNPVETAELPLADISLPDRPLLQPGSIFYWSIGHETKPTGQIQRVSEIRLRRMPQWTQQAMDAVDARAEQLSEWFNTNGENNATQS